MPAMPPMPASSPSSQARASAAHTLSAFRHAHLDRFTIRQRLKAVKNVYEVRVALPDDEEGELVAYVEQKTFALKEDLRFWADEAKTAELFRIKAKQRFDPT